MKPDWKWAPQWAQWLAMDDDGFWYWFELKPEMTDTGVWITRLSGKWQPAVNGEGWAESLEPRP